MVKDQTQATLELLFNISRELASALDIRTVLSRVLFLSVRNVDAERGSLIILDDQEQPMDAAIVYKDQLIPHTADQLRDTLDFGLAGWVLRQKEPALVPDTSKDPRWQRRPDDAANRSGPKSAICIPLIARDETVGVLTIVHPSPGFFSTRHLSLLQSISDQAGIAVNNARLVESLQAANRRYRELFEDSINPIFLTTPDGHIVEANRQAVQTTGYKVPELREKMVIEIHEIDWDQVGEAFQNLYGQKTVSYESVLVQKDEESIPVEVFVREISIEDEHFLQWFFRDISERKELDALREDLIAMIYHDLRSPLSNIISSLDMLQTLIPSEEEPSFVAIFSIANRSSDRLQRLISSLLDIHRLEAGESIIKPEVLHPLSITREAFDAVEYLKESRSQSVEIKIAEEIPVVYADPDILRRILINLIENAVKFTPVGGSIVIGASHEGDWIKFWVQDSGPGIPPEAKERIFNKFARLAGEKVPKGFGLGLAFCRLAVQAHGGRIWVENSPSQGSRFVFTVPVCKDPQDI